MIAETGYRLTCDEPNCAADRFHENPFRLRDGAKIDGWTFYRKLNGEQAIRGGKDYCPEHRKPAAPTQDEEPTR
jgi:hypothetical protein